MAAALVGHAVVPASVRGALLRRLGVQVGGRLEMYSGCHVGSTRVRFGDGVFVNHGVFFDGDAEITVGDRVAFGPHARVITATHVIGGPHRRCDPTPLALPVSVGDGCWVGSGVTILPGVDLAAGCVVAAGAVLTRSTHPHGLYAGVPARRVRDLSPVGSLGPAAPGGAGRLSPG